MLFAQNYRNICSPGITFFKNSSGNIKAFRQDSVYPEGNSDTLFISYRAIRDFRINNCYDTTNGSILGRRIFKNHNGTFTFFNWNHDSLTVKTQAALNETWKFCNLTGSSRIDATVTSIAQDSVLGLTDNVKTITFQAKDHNGVNIPHFLNQKIMSLSEHYGISKTFDLYFMPDTLINDTSSYVLAGKSIPSLGIQNLTWPDIYNFNIGDEFHWSGYIHYGASNNGRSWKTIKRVLAKEVFGSLDSVRYTMEYCKTTFITIPSPTIETIYDTIVDTYDFNLLNNDESIRQLPASLSSDGQWAARFGRSVIYPERQTQEYSTGIYSLNGTCWSFPFEPYYYNYYYTEGLGQTYMFHRDGPFDNTTQESLVYFKKGSKIWGTPLAPNCLTLVPAEGKTKPSIPGLRINPNPLETQAEIYLDNIYRAHLHYFLMNEVGQKILTNDITANPFILGRSGLPGGLYFICILDDKNMILLRETVILK